MCSIMVYFAHSKLIMLMEYLIPARIHFNIISAHELAMIPIIIIKRHTFIKDNNHINKGPMTLKWIFAVEYVEVYDTNNKQK